MRTRMREFLLVAIASAGFLAQLPERSFAQVTRIEDYKANLRKSLPSPGISSPLDDEEIRELVAENLRRQEALEAKRTLLRKGNLAGNVGLARASNDIDVYLDNLPLPKQPEEPPETPQLVGPSTRQYDADDVCVSQGLHAGKRAIDLAALVPNAATLWPGSIVAGGSLEGGLLSPITLARGRGRITLLNTAGNGTAQTVSIKEPSQHAVDDAVTSIRRAAFPNGVPAVAGALMVETYHSVEEAAMHLDVQANWLTGNVRDTLDISSSHKHSHVVVSLVQAYYDLVFETPVSPSAMFKSGTGGVSLKDVRDKLGASAVKPAYVSTIRYGRMILMRASSDADARELKNALQLAMSGLGASGQVNQAFQNNQAIQSTEFQIAVLGSQDQTSVLLSGFAGLQHVQDIWNSGVTLLPAQPAVAISYQVRWLGRDPQNAERDAVAKMTFVSNYNVVTCSPQQILRFGARFQTTDDDKDAGDAVNIDLLKGPEVLSTYWCDAPWNHGWGDGAVTPEPSDADFGGVRGFYSTTAFNRPVFSNEVDKLKLRVRKSGDKGWHFKVTGTLWLESGRQFNFVEPDIYNNEFGGGNQSVVLP